jgi:hypothetical protein
MPTPDDEAWLPAEARATAKKMLKNGTGEELPESSDDKDIYFGRHGERPLLMVRFCQPDGKGKSLAFAHLYAIDFDGQGELVLRFSDDVVRITGWGLGRLHDHLENHRAKLVRVTEAGEREFKRKPEGVEKIEFEAVGKK